MALILKREDQEVDVCLLEAPKKFGHKQIDTRIVGGPEDLDIFLDNMVTIVKAAESMGLPVGIDVFVTQEVTADLAGLLLKHKLTPVSIFVQQNSNPFFDHWGYYQ